jgi:type IV secretory pathway TraG/TraD family ATPase VirD4
MTGKTTIETVEFSESGQKYGFLLENVSRKKRQTERELMTPDEAMRLKSPQRDGSGKIFSPGEPVVFVAGNAPIKGTQSLHFRNPIFSQRVKINLPAISDTALPATVRGRPARYLIADRKVLALPSCHCANDTRKTRADRYVPAIACRYPQGRNPVNSRRLV